METTLSKGAGDKSTTLSQRELEVLNLIMEGQSSKEVAQTLFCTKRTVDFHLTNAYKKLQVSNRVQAMRRLVGLGLLKNLEMGVNISPRRNAGLPRGHQQVEPMANVRNSPVGGSHTA